MTLPPRDRLTGAAWPCTSPAAIIGTVIPVSSTIRDGRPVCLLAPGGCSGMTKNPAAAGAGPADDTSAGSGSGRALRADARRNRQRVLEVAFAVFAAEGLAVPVHEIARRAGLGTGTVSRHFPTKEALFQAVFLDRVERLADRARMLAEAGDPGAAFVEFFSLLV